MSAAGALFVTYSTDNGTTWHAPIAVNPDFVRDVQITGDKVTGDVYIAGMDENGWRRSTTPGQQHLQVHRRRQYLDQHLHRARLPWPRPQRIRASSPACTPAPPTGDTWAGVSLPPSTMC